MDVPTPWMTLQDDLSRANIDPNSTTISDATMPENVDLFKDGKIDLVQLLNHSLRSLKRQEHMFGIASHQEEISHSLLFMR